MWVCWSVTVRGETNLYDIEGDIYSIISVAIFYPKLDENTRRFGKTENLTKNYENQYVVVR